MFHVTYRRVLFIAAAVMAAGSCFGQGEIQLRARQLPGWDPRQREGHCQIRVWVDDRAEVRLRGDRIWVTTLQGAKSRDEGSECSQPLPYNSVSGFQIRQTAGRNQIRMAQEPNRGNNYTALIAIEDPQGGGDDYAFDLTWHADSDVGSAPAPFFDDVRACQDIVRQRFASRNGRGAYIDFDNFADRENLRQGDFNGYQDRNRGPYQNRGPELIQGRGIAKNRGESRDLNYSCVVDTQRGQVQSGSYQYSGDSIRIDERTPLR